MAEEFILKCQFRIESARHLPQLPEGHPCRRVHGHSFHIWVLLQGGLNEIGWVEDYHLIQKTLQEKVFALLDHQLLNEVISNPTTENLARWIYEKSRGHFSSIRQVSVSETPHTECLYPARW